MFGWRTHSAMIIYAHRLDTSREIAVFLHRLIDNSTLLLPGMIIRLKSQIQLIAIPGSGTEMNSSRKVCPRSLPGDKKKHRMESEETLYSFGLPAVSPYEEKKILHAWGQIKVTTVSKASIGFISTICSCCFWLLHFSRTRGEKSAP